MYTWIHTYTYIIVNMRSLFCIALYCIDCIACAVVSVAEFLCLPDLGLVWAMSYVSIELVHRNREMGSKIQGVLCKYSILLNIYEYPWISNTTRKSSHKRINQTSRLVLVQCPGMDGPARHSCQTPCCYTKGWSDRKLPTIRI